MPVYRLGCQGFAAGGRSGQLAVKACEHKETQKMALLENEALVNPSVPHTELIAAFRRAQADAAHKSGLIKAAAKKGPKAIEVAIETAAKAEKRMDSYAKKLHALGVSLKD